MNSNRHLAYSLAEMRRRAANPDEPTYVSGPVDRLTHGASASGNTDRELWKQLMWEWYQLRPAPDWAYGVQCPHRLVGQECTSDDQLCSWDGSRFGPIWDHARMWTNPAGELVLTLEPYGNPFVQAEAFAALERELDELGIATFFEGRSPYGATYVQFLAADDTEAGRRARSKVRGARKRLTLSADRRRRHAEKLALESAITAAPHSTR